MNQAKKAVIKAALDKVLKPAGFKYSLAVKNHMSISCTILAGPLDFIGNFKAVTGDKFKIIPGREIDNLQVNLYWINDHFSGIHADILAQCAQALKAADYYDRSDAMTDYFDTAYYMDLNIGRWDKPYQLTAPTARQAAALMTEEAIKAKILEQGCSAQFLNNQFIVKVI
jgi:hypothetical protein